MKTSISAGIIIVVVASLLVGGVLAVTYVLGMSNPSNTDVQDSQTTITPTVTTPPSITLGQSLTITADCSVNWANKPVYFYDGTTLLGSSVSSASGIATFVTTPTTIGVHAYKAGPLV
jgi:flagellar basal body-associated protein FliL